MTAAEQIDKKLASLEDWRGERLTKIREIINTTEPALTEAFKWNTGMWTYNDTIVCGFGAFKEHVKINFMAGANFPAALQVHFNNGFDAKSSRSIDLREHDELDEAVLQQLIHAAVAAA